MIREGAFGDRTGDAAGAGGNMNALRRRPPRAWAASTLRNRALSDAGAVGTAEVCKPLSAAAATHVSEVLS